MYLKNAVSIPANTKKIIFVKTASATYVYYQTDRIYNSDKKYNSAKRTIIGKICPSDNTMMLPNERFFQYFPDVPYHQEEEAEADRSCAIRFGTYTVIRHIIDELHLQEVLGKHFEPDDLGLLLDLASYSIITENNAGQYYPMYAYDHALLTTGMKIYSDSKVSEWMRKVTASQTIRSINDWNASKSKKDKVYFSYDSTNKNSQEGDVEFVEYGEAKVRAGLPIINYSLAYDTTERIPLYYESYPGSIPDVAQFRCMVGKAVGYGYKNIGFILDRGYFSEKNIQELDENNYDFIIMVKGRKKLVRSIIREKLHTFEKKSSCYIEEYELFGCTVMKKLFESDKKDRYIHLYHNVYREAREQDQFNEDLRRMKKLMDKAIGTEMTFSKAYSEYFELFYNNVESDTDKKDKNGKKIIETHTIFAAYKEKEDVVEQCRDLCGYFAIATSKKMTAAEALRLYKSRDMSEKLFRGDKSYLGDKSMRTYSSESTETKIFVEFIALIIRSRIYSRLHDLNLRLPSKQNFLTVPAAIRELEKIMMIQLPDGRYHMSHAVTKTQKTILSAFGMTAEDITNTSKNISDQLEEGKNGQTPKANNR